LRPEGTPASLGSGLLKTKKSGRTTRVDGPLNGRTPSSDTLTSGCKEAIDIGYKGTMGKEPGILVYGPFAYPIDFNHAFTNKCDYRIFIHVKDDCDVLDFFAYG